MPASPVASASIDPGDPGDPADPRPDALVAVALARLDASVSAWPACEGGVPRADLLDRAMGVLAG